MHFAMSKYPMRFFVISVPTNGVRAVKVFVDIGQQGTANLLLYGRLNA